MFKEELMKFLLSTESFNELDESYMSDFDFKHVQGISYEQGYPMLIDCCEVWIQYPEYTWELIDIMGSIKNMISTNTFPDIFIENKQNILAIYFDTKNRVRTLISRVHESDNVDEKLIESSIESGIKDEKLIFAGLFYRFNINWSV